MLEAIRAGFVLFIKNLTIRDPRSLSRHPWRWCLFVMVDILISRIPISRPKSGVAVVLVNRLGDAVVAKPLVIEIRSSLKKQNEPFLVLGDKSWEVLKENVYKDVPTRFIDGKRFQMELVYRIKVSVWLRFQNYHTVICFMHHRLEMRDDALVYLSGGEAKIVAELPFLDLRWYPWLFECYLNKMSLIIPALPPITTSLPQVDEHCNYQRKVPHVLERLQDFARHLDPTMGLKIEHLTFPSEHNLFSEKIVILNPGAKHEARMWPLREWVSLAYQIASSGYTVCFIGGPAEESLNSELHSLLKAMGKDGIDSSRIVVMINSISFNGLIGLFCRAACYIGPDTGTSHLAYWVGTPTITLLLHNKGTEESDRFGDFFPYPEGFLSTPYRCICTTKAKFHMRDGTMGIRPQVWSAFNDLMRSYARNDGA